MATTTNKPTKEQLTAAFAHARGDDKHMMDYCDKKTDTAVILSSGAIFAIDKEDINTRFCFGYSTCGQGAEYDEATKAERHAAIIAAYEEHHRKHCKKVETYLKRYGLSEVKTWTYWVDE